MSDNPYDSSQAAEITADRSPPAADVVRCKCGLEIPTNVANPGASVRCPDCRRIVRLPGKTFNATPARMYVAVLSFLPFTLPLLWLSHQAKKDYEAGNYDEAMHQMKRLFFYCNLAIALFYGPLLLFLLAAFAADMLS